MKSAFDNICSRPMTLLTSKSNQFISVPNPNYT